MRIDASHITLRRLRFHAYHGVLEQERIVGNDYEVTVRMDGDFLKAVETDEVTDTVNYAEVYNVIKTEMAVPSKLLEHVAGRIGRSLLYKFPMLQAVHVEVVKQNPPMGADCDGAEVSINIRRE